MKGTNFLKISGILMVVCGSIAIIAGIIAIAGIAALLYVSSGELSPGLLYASGALMLASSVAELVAGIIGIKNCKKPEKAMTCIVWGAIVAFFCVMGNVLSVAGGTGIDFPSLIIGLALPALYICGAVLNKKSVNNNQ